jgi:hypothetical protein
MNPPAVNVTRNAAPAIDQIGTYIPVPGMGHFAVNSFLIRSRVPVLVDAGIVTTFLGMSKLGFARSIPPDRFYWLNPVADQLAETGVQVLTPVTECPRRLDIRIQGPRRTPARPRSASVAAAADRLIPVVTMTRRAGLRQGYNVGIT